MPDPLAAVVVAATAVFALAGIGGPLLGMSVFADTGSLSDYSGYRDVLDGTKVQNDYVRDLVDSAMPNSILFGEALRSGDFAAWNPYALGGGPLGANPNAAVASPLSAPWWVLPGWLAPGYEKLLEIICGVGGMFLFLRRLRLSRAAAWLGGLVFVSSAFMVAWTGWPQTRVACLIPALFWALERLAQRVRPREIALVSLPVAGMLFGGFPAIVGYTMLTAASYLLVRVVAEHRAAWRPIVVRLAAAGAGVAAGLGLAAWQLVPWARFMASAYVEGRTQNTNDHIPVDALLTAITPYAFGTTNPGYPPTWFGSLQLIDAESYVGAAAVVLVVTALAAAATARRLLPRGTWWLLVGASLVWTIVVYFGGPLLEVLQGSSALFSENFVGRARSVLGMLFAVLAAVGFEAALRRRRDTAEPAPSWPRRLYGVTIWGGLAVAGVFLYHAGQAKAIEANAHRTSGPDHLTYLNSQVTIGLALMIVAGGCTAWLWWWRPRTRTRAVALRRARVLVAALLPLLIAGQALWWVRSYYPRTDRNDFYPSNPTQQFLAANLGHQRYFGTDGAIFGSVDTTARLRSFDGHAFLDQSYAELAQSLPGEQFHIPATTITSDKEFAAGVAVNPVLDRAAVRYYVAPPEVAPFGQLQTDPSDGTQIDLAPGVTVSVPVRADGGLRGLGIAPAPAAPATLAPATASPLGQAAADVASQKGSPTPVAAASPPSSAHLQVTIRDSSGRVLATGDRQASSRVGDQLQGDTPWFVPLAGEDIPAGTDLTAEITALGPTPLRVAGANGRPALTTVTSLDDGLRLVYARESVIYERSRALDRAHWASSATVVTDPNQAVNLLAAGTLGPDTVLLNAPGPATSGLPASVNWATDGLNEMVVSVQAQGAGYLVLADAIQNGWKATVDDVDATIVPADHAFVAVAVPAGTHTIRFFYPEPFSGLGAWATGLTILALLGMLGGEIWLRRQRPPVRFDASDANPGG